MPSPRRPSGRTKAREKSGISIAWAAVVAVAAVMQRVLYFIATDPKERAYDPEGHIEYVRWMANNVGIPMSKDGWEFFQPPLYYWIGGFIARITRWFGTTDPVETRLIQSFSLWTAVATVLIGIWVLLKAGRTLPAYAMALGAAVMAFMPSHVLMAGLIGNDTLLTLFSFAGIGLLYAWWTTQRNSAWYGALVCIALAIITKSNAYLLVPFAGILFFSSSALRSAASLKRALVGTLILFTLAGWYPAYRFGADKYAIDAVATAKTPAAIFITNLTNLHSNLRLPNSLANFATFAPHRLLQFPYNDPWKDTARRQYFWEFAYRSMIVLDHDHGPMLRWASINMMFLGFAFFPLTIIGIVASAKRDPHTCFFFLSLGLILLGGHVAMRIMAPYSSTQAFRYSLPLLLSLGYFCMHGIAAMPQSVKGIAIITVGSFCYLCLAFTASFLVV